MKLVKYEAAKHALAEAKAIDDVVSIVKVSEQMKAYAKISKDKTLEIDAAEIRMRAERRLGQLILQQKSEEGLHKGGRPKCRPPAEDSANAAAQHEKPVVANDRFSGGTPKLSDVGVSKDQSSRAQKYAKVPDEQFEEEIEKWKERVSIEGERVSSRLESIADARELQDAVEMLAAENERLKDLLAVESMEATEDAKLDAHELIRSLRAEIETLRAELDAAIKARDRLMNERAEMVRQIKYWKRKAGA